MKNRIFLFFCFMLCTIGVIRAEDALQVVPFTTTAGVVEDDWEYFTVDMKNTASYTALQFDMYLPEGMTLIDDGPMELSSDRFPGYTRKGVFYPYHTYECTLMNDGHYLITIYSTDLYVIDGTEGDLLYFYYQTDGNMADGCYSITMENVVLTVDSHTDYKPANSSSFVQIGTTETFDASVLEGNIPSFVVEEIPTTETYYDFSNVDNMGESFVPDNPNCVQYVKEGSSYAASAVGNVVSAGICESLIITDGYDFSVPTSFTANTISYERNMTNKWGTICLPYAVESDDKVQYYRLLEVQDNTIVFTPVTEIQAGEPAVFQKVGDDTTIDFSSGTASIVTDSQDEDPIENLKLIGTFERQRIDVNESSPCYYIKNNTFCKGSEYFIVPAFRAYFESQNINNAKQLSIAVLDDATGTPTIIGELNSDTGEIYTLNGVKTTINDAKGIIIRNNQKWIIK